MALKELIPAQEIFCKKTCSVKEFRVTRDLGRRFEGNFTFTMVNFNLPDATRGYLSKTPYKTIKTEQYILSGLHLLGNVGGILGIFVGFSLSGVTEQIVSVGEVMWKRFSP